MHSTRPSNSSIVSAPGRIIHGQGPVRFHKGPKGGRHSECTTGLVSHRHASQWTKVITIYPWCLRKLCQAGEHMSWMAECGQSTAHRMVPAAARHLFRLIVLLSTHSIARHTTSSGMTNEFATGLHYIHIRQSLATGTIGDAGSFCTVLGRDAGGGADMRYCWSNGASRYRGRSENLSMPQ